jgi:NADH-quinone oxidoreductase subunit L
MEYLAVFPPLVAFLIAGLLGRKMGDAASQAITCLGVIVAAAASIALFFDVVLGSDPRIIPLMSWISSGSFQVDWTLRVDQLTVVMMCVINIVSACVHVYSVGYMSHDDSKPRFMAYLSLFTFAMLMLVTADNLLQLFFGWEGVGLASYLLIGFWYHKPSAALASMKAFVVNRFGDFGFALGIMTTFVIFGTIQFGPIFEAAPSKVGQSFTFFWFNFDALTLMCLLLFVGAMGKSAQLGLHTWLPDAMEGPTPVSALIHAATMVTAGVFLVARFSPVFEYAPDALMIVCVVGALTAFIAATIGMTQFDIKRVIAYSTMSQLGYMFFALGVSAYGAAMFHLMTHAFFKALLFLGAGSVIHAMSGEQDMRKMGGIWKKIPLTYGLMWIGGLALAGIPLFAGYYSKDIILEAAFADHTWFGTMAFWLGISAALMTAFYTWRLILMTFHGKCRADEEVQHHIHESPAVMTLPLVVLATGAVFAGALFYDGFINNATGGKVIEHEVAADEGGVDVVHGGMVGSFWGDSLKVLPENDTIAAAHHVPEWVKLLPVVVGAAGIVLGFIAYMFATGIPAAVSTKLKGLHTLFFRKWYFDELYDIIFVKMAFGLGLFFWKRGDQGFIDTFGPNGFASVSQLMGRVLSKLQTGYVYQYAFVMILGLIALVTWVSLRTGLVG